MSDPVAFALIAMIGTSVASTVAAGLAYLKSRDNSIAIKDLHVIVNDRLTQLLKATGDMERAAGFAEGSTAQSDRGDVIAQKVLDAAALKYSQDKPPSHPEF